MTSSGSTPSLFASTSRRRSRRSDFSPIELRSRLYGRHRQAWHPRHQSRRLRRRRPHGGLPKSLRDAPAFDPRRSLKLGPRRRLPLRLCHRTRTARAVSDRRSPPALFMKRSPETAGVYFPGLNGLRFFAAMSASPSKADIGPDMAHVCFGPEAVLRRHDRGSLFRLRMSRGYSHFSTSIA